MATAWEILTSNSDLPPGHTAWEYLNSQQGGGSSVVLSDGLELDMEECEFDVLIELDAFDVEIYDEHFDIELDEAEYELEVC